MERIVEVPIERVVEKVINVPHEIVITLLKDIKNIYHIL